MQGCFSGGRGPRSTWVAISSVLVSVHSSNLACRCTSDVTHRFRYCGIWIPTQNCDFLTDTPVGLRFRHHWSGPTTLAAATSPNDCSRVRENLVAHRLLFLFNQNNGTHNNQSQSRTK